MIISSLPVKKQADSSPQYYPLIVAFRKADFCEKVSESAEQLSEQVDQIIALYNTAGNTIKARYGAKIAQLAEHKTYLDDLKIKAMLTGATITIQLKTFEAWMKVVQAGYIIDVFTEDGLRAVAARLEQSRQFVLELLTDIESAVEPGASISPED